MNWDISHLQSWQLPDSLIRHPREPKAVGRLERHLEEPKRPTTTSVTSLEVWQPWPKARFAVGVGELVEVAQSENMLNHIGEVLLDVQRGATDELLAAGHCRSIAAAEAWCSRDFLMNR